MDDLKGLIAKLDDGLAEFLQPRYRIFFSADIVGSTSIKASSARWGEDHLTLRERTENSWIERFRAFFEEFPQLFWQTWRELSDDCPPKHADKFGSPPAIWKTVGDEIVFEKHITDLDQVHVCIAVWLLALERYRENDDPLAIKCCCFGAGFPVTNTELYLEKNPARRNFSDNPRLGSNYNLELAYRRRREGSQTSKDEDFIHEYMGPAIDCGFRLSDLSSVRKMPVSIEVAWFLASCHFNDDELKEMGIGGIELNYDGRRPLRGVWGGDSYPLFWIDTSEKLSLKQAENNLLHGRHPVLNDKIVRDFAAEYFKSSSNSIRKPFIVDQLSDLNDEEHAPFVRLLARENDLFLDELNRAVAIVESGKADVSEGDDSAGDRKEIDPDRQKSIVDEIKRRVEERNNSR